MAEAVEGVGAAQAAGDTAAQRELALQDGTDTVSDAAVEGAQEELATAFMSNMLQWGLQEARKLQDKAGERLKESTDEG